MSTIVRFSVSLEDDLLADFDKFCLGEHFATRSEAVRQLIREKLTQKGWEGDCPDAAGTLTLVYDHHRPQLRDHLMAIQHDHNDLVVSTLHAHLTHDVCLEVIVLRGPAAQLAEIAARLRGLKGIFKGELVMANATDCPIESPSQATAQQHPPERAGKHAQSHERTREHACHEPHGGEHSHEQEERGAASTAREAARSHRTGGARRPKPAKSRRALRGT